MLPDQVSNPGPMTYESGALPIALHGPALSGPRKFSLRYRKFGMNFNFEISRLHCIFRGSNFATFILASFLDIGKLLTETNCSIRREDLSTYRIAQLRVPCPITDRQTDRQKFLFYSSHNTVELQWLKHLWDHEI